ncbi:hypothetical protein GO986_12265 [Deinococcus sp. HMF7620]|uniref:Uncharacterized protein n=1 Tax=Deinococcus arboris TaxID=2682977 RepID=A0A7C9LUV6_9DEIO|nr:MULTISPECIES: hypothetical protein [Deinococcus]MBZ9752206.1 hypothetical protein [Deinococcus betulae]MVN87540.1 hypothetical protein [Deinococcus arboris]
MRKQFEVQYATGRSITVHDPLALAGAVFRQAPERVLVYCGSTGEVLEELDGRLRCVWSAQQAPALEVVASLLNGVALLSPSADVQLTWAEGVTLLMLLSVPDSGRRDRLAQGTLEVATSDQCVTLTLHGGRDTLFLSAPEVRAITRALRTVLQDSATGAALLQSAQTPLGSWEYKLPSPFARRSAPANSSVGAGHYVRPERNRGRVGRR